MRKTIKVDEQTYKDLDEIRDKRETFDEVVKRVIAVFKQIQQLSDDLGPGHYLKSDTSPGGHFRE